MMKISASEFRGELGQPAHVETDARYYRGWIERRGVMRFTLKAFETREEAELYALKMMLRWRSVFGAAPHPSVDE